MNKSQDRGVRRAPKGMSVPKTFDQLGILVLDGSGSMGFGESARKVTLAQEVSTAVKDTFTTFKASAQKKNFSFAVVYYDDTAKVELPITEVKDLDDMRAYDPTTGMGGTTSIAAGLKEAQKLAEDHLKGQTPGGIEKTVVIVILSDGLDMTEQETVAIANQLKQNSKVLLTACFFETLGGDIDEMNQAANFLQSICSAPNYFEKVFDAEKVRNFFVASVSNQKKL